MHQADFDLNLDKITKVEGSAGLEIRVKDNKVEHVHFKISEFKRFYTQAIRGKPVVAVPQLLSRICGTCSNAHIMCSIEAAEKALGIKPSEKTLLMRILTMYSLMIRDHALHLYLFVLPDIFNKDSFLELDEKDEAQHQLLHDAFDIKAAGNYLSTIIAGRSVHGPYPTVGGFTHFPEKQEIEEAIKKLESIRPGVLRLIEIFKNSPFHFDRRTKFMGLVGDRFDFLRGAIISSTGDMIPEEKFGEHLERVVIPYSQASGYEFEGESYMVGALARINLAKDRLHSETKKSAEEALSMFPSTDMFNNNLAQAIEILHCLDDSLDILKNNSFDAEEIIKFDVKQGIGVGVIEAPRGTLYHKLEVNDKGIVEKGEVIIPTGQNQINIEKDIGHLVDELIPETSEDKIVFEIEKLIRAYDPCMSCASHFLKVDWKK